MINKYTKKPVTIEAIRYIKEGDINTLKECLEFCYQAKYCQEKDELVITTLEGDHLCSEGDYIIKGVKGEFYPCKPDIFQMTYDRC